MDTEIQQAEAGSPKIVTKKKPICPFKPTKGHIIIEKKAVEEKQGGLIIPNSTKANEPYEADIIYSASEEFCEGDKVMIPCYAGMKLERDNVEYRVLNDKDVICKITGV